MFSAVKARLLHSRHLRPRTHAAAQRLARTALVAGVTARCGLADPGKMGQNGDILLESPGFLNGKHDFGLIWRLFFCMIEVGNMVIACYFMSNVITLINYLVVRRGQGAMGDHIPYMDKVAAKELVKISQPPDSQTKEQLWIYMCLPRNMGHQWDLMRTSCDLTSNRMEIQPPKNMFAQQGTFEKKMDSRNRTWDIDLWMSLEIGEHSVGLSLPRS